MSAKREAATVVVVGAGLSGLTAARELHRNGVAVLVLEAADRVGGRALRETTALGSQVDLGGQWIGHDHHRLMALATELGLTRFPMHTQPLPTILGDARPLRTIGPTMLVTGLVLAAVEAATRFPTPIRWNDVSVQSWLRGVPGTARRLLDVLATISWTADLDRMSLYAAISMLRGQGGLRTALATRGGAQDSLLVEAIGAIPEALAADLGHRVRLGQPVTSITRAPGGITVRTPSAEIHAQKIAVTVPPPMAARIDYQPPLPAERTEIQQNSYMGSVYKAIAVYPKPFWRERHGAEFIVLERPGRAVFDSGAPGGPGHLCILVGGPEARELDGLTADARRKVLLGALVPYLGADVLDPAGWHDKSWHLDEFAGGGYMSLPVPGSRAGCLPVASAPVDDIHWAGTETATEHPGYLEGAIQSGLRVAAEIIEALGSGDAKPEGSRTGES